MIPGADLVIGLFVQVLVWLVVTAVKLCARLVWSGITEHPGISFLGVLVARDQGWITSPWIPFVLAALGVLAIARFFTAHPPAQVAQRARREVRKAYVTGAAITDTGRKARRWVARTGRSRVPDMPLPPSTSNGHRPVADEPIPVGPVEVVKA